mmetsp:Transcript_75897/g.104882  ORF Transcript_75897/g.104882 Transcript_75897/m.104882 type:complete len:92 (+) Transcript_75897:655-930(+)
MSAPSQTNSWSARPPHFRVRVWLPHTTPWLRTTSPLMATMAGGHRMRISHREEEALLPCLGCLVDSFIIDSGTTARVILFPRQMCDVHLLR